ncbi:hypothetical protein CLOM_g19289 [Closterium sp. NIES-68]|nr:hypothetical protein CLOM_g19289 [Closterium sp. NIES-68]GJP58911.1 hypothetical protein CLOP_g6682 [Closterium sp. NIES-67]
MESDSTRIEARHSYFVGEAQTDRRLHQLMFADRDYEAAGMNIFPTGAGDEKLNPSVSVGNLTGSQYTIIKLTCLDRPKLLFDTVCTLTDMQYIIHHATIESEDDVAFQELYIRTMDGSMLDTEAERERVVKCLEAAILRRSPKGICLDLCTGDRVGLLCDVTRVLQTHNLSITAANICTRWGKAVNEFYVTDSANRPVDFSIIEAIREEIGPEMLTIRNVAPPIFSSSSPPQEESSFSFTRLFRSLSLGLSRENQSKRAPLSSSLT